MFKYTYIRICNKIGRIGRKFHLGYHIHSQIGKLKPTILAVAKISVNYLGNESNTTVSDGVRKIQNL